MYSGVAVGSRAEYQTTLTHLRMPPKGAWSRTGAGGLAAQLQAKELELNAKEAENLRLRLQFLESRAAPPDRSRTDSRRARPDPPARRRPDQRDAGPPRATDKDVAVKRTRARRASAKREQADQPASPGTGAAPAAAVDKPPPTATKGSRPGALATALAEHTKAQADAATARRLALDPAFLKTELPLLAESVLQPVLDSIAQEPVPAPFSARAPEEILAEYLGEDGPTGVAAQKSQHQQRVAALEGLLVAYEGAGMDKLLPALRAELVCEQAALRKLARDLPSPESELQAMIAAKQDFATSVSSRKDKMRNGKEKTESRARLRLEHINAVRKELDMLERKTLEAVAGNNRKHEARARALEETDQVVLDLFEKRLEALRAKTTDDRVSDALRQGDGPKTVTGDGQASTPSNQLAMATLTARPDTSPDGELQKELEALRFKCRDLEQKVAAAVTVSIADFEQHYDLTPDMLPVAVLPQAEEAVTYGAVHTAFIHWEVSGASHAFLWGALEPITGSAEVAASVCRKVVGDEIWKKFYGDIIPASRDVVPRQLVQVTRLALDTLGLKFTAEQQARRDELGKLGAESIKGCKRPRTTSE